MGLCHGDPCRCCCKAEAEQLSSWLGIIVEHESNAIRMYTCSQDSSYVASLCNWNLASGYLLLLLALAERLSY